MKSAEDWKILLGSINFPNFNKTDNEEVLEFIFSDCKQRDALLTWIVIQLGAAFKSNRILTHEVIIEYLKRRRVLREIMVEDFVNAALSKENQEAQWDKLFNFVKMQKRLLPMPYEGVPEIRPDIMEYTDFTQTYQDYSKVEYMEPLYKELEMLKKLKRLKPEEMEATLTRNYEQEQTDTNEKNKDSEGFEQNDITEKNKEEVTHRTKMDIGEVELNRLLRTEKTKSGTWYYTPDRLRKVFVPLGAPPLGELDFDPKKMKMISEDDRAPATEKDAKSAQNLEAFFRSFQKIKKKNP